MVVGDFVKGGTGSISGNMAAESVVFAVGIHNHGHGVPANEAFDAGLDFPVARIRRLFLCRDRIDVGRMRGWWNFDAGFAEAIDQIIDKIRGLAGALIAQGVLDDEFEGFEPFTGVRTIFAIGLLDERGRSRFDGGLGCRTRSAGFSFSNHSSMIDQRPEMPREMSDA